MKVLYLATTNERKVREAQAAAKAFEGLRIESFSADIVEIQSPSGRAVVLDKVRKAYAVSKKPTVVTDTFWEIPALGGFPGPYMKDVTTWLDDMDWLTLMSRHKDKTILFNENIGFFDGEKEKIFSKQFEGKFVSSPRGKGTYSMERVTEFEGRTLAEAQDANETSHRPEEYVWFDCLRWFAGR